jgi:hypothetical protein
MAAITRKGITLLYEVSRSGSPIILTYSFLCDGYPVGPEGDWHEKEVSL